MTRADELKRLELSLLSSAVRLDANELSRLLSDDFREFGGSGVVYDRAAAIDALGKESTEPFARIDVSDLAVTELGPGAALVTYRSAREGKVRLRSSVWREEDGTWRMVFHQATPAAI